MTSQASLIRKAKAARFSPALSSFRQAAREGWALAVLSLLVYAAVFLIPLLSLIENFRYDTETRITDAYRYCFFSGDGMKYALPAIICGLSVLQGVFTFKPLFSRKSTNAWFSIGISRRGLFLSRYLAGACLAVLPLAAGLGASLAANLSVFPEAGFILSRFFYELAGLSVQALAAYTVTAAVCSSVGTWVEGAVYSAAAVAAPTVLLYSLNRLMQQYLFGNCFGWYSGSDLQPRQYLHDALAAYNPLTFFYRESAAYAQAYAPIRGLPAGVPQPAAMPPAPFPWAAVGWFVAALLLAWLAWRIFRARKAEITGVMGLNRPLAVASAGVAACLVFTLAVYLPVKAALCLAAGYGMLAAMRALKKPVWKSLIAPPAYLAAVFIAIGLLSAGGFGYSGFVPDKSNVSSVAITYMGAPDLAPEAGASNNFLLGLEDYDADVLLTDAADFDTAIAIHRALVSAGPLPRGKTSAGLVVSAVIHITYTMKDGSVVARDYDRASMATLRQMLTLDETQGVRRAMQGIVTGSGGYAYTTNGDNFRYGLVYLCGKLAGGPKLLQLDSLQRAELIRRIAEDVDAESLQGRYFPTEQPVCTLAFRAGDEVWPEGTNLADYRSTRVFVSAEYRNTLDFLNSLGLLDTPPEAQRVRSIKAARIDSFAARLRIPPVFLSTSLDYPQNLSDELGFLHVKVAEFTDEASVGKLLDCCFEQYACTDGGYLLYCQLESGDTVISAFVPPASAPAFLVEALK